MWEAKAEIHSIITSTEDPYTLSFPIPVSACCNTCLGNPVVGLFDREIETHSNAISFQESLEKYFQSWKPKRGREIKYLEEANIWNMDYAG